MSDSMKKLRARFAMDDGLAEKLFTEQQRSRLEEHLDFTGVDPFSHDGSDAAGDPIQVLITGWGAPSLGLEELQALPALRAIHHTGGTVKTFLGDDVWERNVLVTSAAAANAVPVAEFALAAILFSGKSVFEIASAYAVDPMHDRDGRHPAAVGNYGRTIGIVGASQIGRRVIELLEPFDFHVVVFDPFLADSDPILRLARSVGIEELFGVSDTVSIHAPLLPETTGMVTEQLMESMRPGAVLINTARAGIVDQEALVRLVEANRIQAVLDVTDPEPLPVDHALRRLPGGFLTPHLAGARGNELFRLGESVVLEVEAFARGLPPLHPVLRSSLQFSA